MTPSTDLLKNIAYRLKAVHIGQIALRQMIEWDTPPPMQVFFDGKLKYEGLATGFTNGAIEAGTVHARALLEFLGVSCKSGTNDKLAQRPRRYPGSIYVEDFTPLQKMTVSQVIRAYPGDPDEAEASIAFLMHVANKSLAHITTGQWEHPEGQRLLEIGIQGVPALVINNFYVPLRITPPEYKVSSRAAS